MIRKIKYCECGCKEEIVYKVYHKHCNVRFIRGHHRRNTKHSEKTIRIMSELAKGENNSMYNKHPSKKTRTKRSKALLKYWSIHCKPFVEKYCECGCGILLLHANRGQRFVHGHNGKGKPGKSPWCKDKTKENYPQLVHTKEARKKMSISHTNVPLSEEHRKAIGKAGEGKKRTEKTKQNIRESLEGRKLSEEHIENLRISHTGLKYSDEMRKKCSKNSKGENNPAWKGGMSFEPYTIEFNDELKELIRLRDGFRCQLCSCPQEENLRKLAIHHIDYIKKNCNLSNLISLCMSCHTKTQFNRSKWQEYFTNKLTKRVKKKSYRILIEES